MKDVELEVLKEILAKAQKKIGLKKKPAAISETVIAVGEPKEDALESEEESPLDDVMEASEHECPSCGHKY